MDLHLRDLRYFVVTEIRKLGGTEVICTEDEDLAARVNEIAGTRGVRKALDCVAGQLGADVFQALAPQGELVVDGALATHRQTDPSALTIPLFARSVIYDAKSLRGFWLFHWVVIAPPEQVAATLTETRKLVTHGILEIPRGQPIPVEHFTDAVAVAEAPAHGTKPLLVLTYPSTLEIRWQSW